MEISVFLKQAQNTYTDMSIYVQIYRTALVCDYIHSMNNGNHNRAAQGKYTPLWSLQQARCAFMRLRPGAGIHLVVLMCLSVTCTRARTHKHTINKILL